MAELTARQRWAALETVWCTAAEVAKKNLAATPWQARAACAARPELPWIAEPADLTAWDTVTMAAVCADCPVLAECAAYTTQAAPTAGWWAGTHRDPNYASPEIAPDWVPVGRPGTPAAGHVWQGRFRLRGQSVTGVA